MLTASGAMTFQPNLDLRLQADSPCYLNHQTRFSLVIFLTLTGEQPITLIRSYSNDHTGLKELLVSRCIECTEVESGQRIPVLGTKYALQSTSSETECPAQMTLEPERSSYMTFTTATNPREYEFVFNSSALKPDNSYRIQCKPSALDWWSFDSQEKISEYYKTHGKLPPSETPPLQCESSANNVVKFSARSEVAPAPQVSISLLAPPTISLFSTPRFSFSLTFTSYATKPITVLAERPSTKAGNTDMEILEATTRKRLAPDLIDSGNKDGPWLREDFV